MANTHRLSMIGAVIVCLAGAQMNVTVFASEDASLPVIEAQRSASEEPAPAISIDDLATATVGSLTPLPTAAPTRLTLDAGLFAENPSPVPLAQGVQRRFRLAPSPAMAAAGQIRQGRPYPISRSGSIAAIMVGAVATIAGTAVLVYANRPECTTSPFAGGCGYGTKVIGGSVLAGGVVGLFVGALTWR